ncbi:putative rare lipoprotein A [Aromatoleum aromaticum EbN1]|uniref:Endolytic peptidoglycan transglycosylase RlpA n=2 Tax=Aromatoleum aromaticum TaxID=551760 RepID=Q5P496_AROAE|nr:septal ring lytic transglycosylase RlpA family protein [Aromatoleum aromaticum]NMG56832.1 septal ring lytic transglycosylase RlpA family protein [Aromatoleum aromaticum]CAI07867.1 putative rare lipoprotein A [Aromatoleum aromaticum EbN1]
MGPGCNSRAKRRIFAFLGAAAVAILLSLPAQGEQPARGEKVSALETRTGLASYYARSLHGRETASGETFDRTEMVAAHPSYPLGTHVRVTNRKNGRAVVVRINDRGPTKPSRKEGVIIDLSPAAAARLGMIKDGRSRVKVEVLEWGDDDRQ